MSDSLIRLGRRSFEVGLDVEVVGVGRMKVDVLGFKEVWVPVG